MLGHKLTQRFSKTFDIFSTIRGKFGDYEKYGIFEKAKTVESVDVEKSDDIRKVFENVKPDVIVNCVGVIKQQPSAKDAVSAIKINALLPHQLAEFADEFGAKLISISTDCVFDGKDGNFSENDFPNPNDLYGKSKQLGEVIHGNHLTIRSSFIGRELCTSHSLLEWFLSNQGKTIKGFANALYSGFPTVIFADIISDLISNHEEIKGLYHVSSEPINKFDLLNLIKEEFHIEVDIERYEDFRIDRSLDSTKFREATGFRPRPWAEMIREMAQDAVPYSKWR